MKKYIKKFLNVVIIAIFITTVLSCEEDFTDIGSNVISNTKFDTNAELVDIQVENSQLRRIQTDNISQQVNQYLLGVFNPTDYEKIEASIVSQVRLPLTEVSLVDRSYGADTTVVTTIDTAFVKLPYQISVQQSGLTSTVVLDSVFGDSTKPFSVNVYQSNTFFNRFNPADPSKTNTFFSDTEVEKKGAFLNTTFNYPLQPNVNDSILPVTRKTSDGSIYTVDTLRLNTAGLAPVQVPFARIPLKKDIIKSIFLDNYESTEFSSQENFNNYFRGLILEASGEEGALIGFDFTNSLESLNPSIEIYYTNTVLVNNVAVDTIAKSDSFRLSGIRYNQFTEENRTYSSNTEVKIQGTAGSEALITLFDQEKIDELRANNWLVNDASLTFYINQSIDTSLVPLRITAYKTTGGSNPVFSQIKDAYTEAATQGIRGFLETDSNGRKEKYTFNITDYVSDILSGATNSNPQLKLKVFNTTDLPVSESDTIFRNYSWNPKAVTLFNGNPVNGDKKAVLKISYSKRK